MDIAKYEIDPMYGGELDIYVSNLGDWYDVKEVDEEIREFEEELKNAWAAHTRAMHDGALLKNEVARLKGELSKAVATIRLYEETLNARL